MRYLKFKYVWQHEETGNIVVKILDIFSIETVNPNNGMNRYSLIDRLQWCGIADKNGKDYFENDIVKDKYGTLGVVKFGEGEYNPDWYGVDWFGWFLDGIDTEFSKHTSYEMEILGNIYETPDLLLGK